MARLRKNNGSYVNEASIEAELWDYFCSREPVRCGKMPHEVAAMSKPLKSREITKELQGGPIWTFLNTLAAVWEEGLHPYFLATCNAIVSILECPDCQREWRLILKETPPSGLKNKLSVCRWVWNAHNTVRRRIGRADYPWEAAVKEWGFPVA